MKTVAVIMITITIALGVQLGHALETGLESRIATIDALDKLAY